MIPFLQKLILQDFWLKLFSFALAWLIWFTINIAIKNDISPVASLSLGPTEQFVLRGLPVSVLSSVEETQPFSITPKSVDVTLQGAVGTLKNLRKQDVRILVDLSENGAIRDERKRLQVSTPAGITTIKVEPEEVQIAVNAKN